MADLTGMGVRWPLGGVGFGGDGGASVINNVTGALFKTAGMMEEQKAADAKAKAAEAARQQQLDQQADLGLLQTYTGKMGNKDLPRSEQWKWYNAAREITSKRGWAFPEISEEEWNPGFAKYVDRAARIIGDPSITPDEKEQILGAYELEVARENPQAALYFKRERDRNAAQVKDEIDAYARTAYRILTGAPDLTDEERGTYLGARAIAFRPDANDDLETRKWKEHRSKVLFAAERQALAQRDEDLKRRKETFLTPGKDTRVIEQTPGGLVERVAPAPEPAKEPGTLVERIEQLQASGKPEDAAKADRLLMLQDRTKQSMTINLPKTPPAEFIQTAQSVGLIARRVARTVGRFDPEFVGMLGKLKGLSTKFSDLPGIPAFKDRKEFANDLIATTSDVKKILLGATRTVPELADVGRFLPDPDQNLSVAEFTGNLSTFIEQYIDVMDVLPDTLEQAGLKRPDFTKERKLLTGALEKLRGGGGTAAPADGAGTVQRWGRDAQGRPVPLK